MTKVNSCRALSYYFERMSQSFKKSESFGIDGVIEFKITGEEGCDSWFIIVHDQTCHITQEKLTSDTRITIEKGLFIDGFLGKADMTQAFISRLYRIEGNLELAMSMNFIFENPKSYNEWFFKMENSLLPDCSREKRIVYRFSILDEPIFEDNIPINEPELHYRNVIIDNGTCTVLPLAETEYNVEFVIGERALLKMIEGTASYYDLFLLNEFDFNGPNKDIFEFTSYFSKELFPNAAITNLTTHNVFRRMPKMVDDIPKKIHNKIICMNIIGKDSGVYYIRVLEDSINIISKENVERVHAKITMSDKTFFGFCFNEIDYHSALDESLIQFQGDVNVGMTFDSVFKYRFSRNIETVNS